MRRRWFGLLGLAVGASGVALARREFGPLPRSVTVLFDGS